MQFVGVFCFFRISLYFKITHNYGQYTVDTMNPAESINSDTVEAGQVGHDNSSQDVIERLSGELKEITALYNIGVALNSSLNPKEVVWTLYKETSRLIDASNFALAIYDHAHNSLKFLLVFDQGQRVNPFSIKLSSGNSGLTDYAFTSQSPILVRDLATSDKKFEMSRLHPDKQMRSWLGVPIINPAQANETAQGAIVTWNYEPDAFTNHHVWLLSAIGTQASIAIRNARL